MIKITRALQFWLVMLLSNTISGQITKHPLLEYSTADNLIIKEINIMDDPSKENYTIISFELNPIQQEYFMIPKGMYINDATDARNRYELICFFDDDYEVGKWYPIKDGESYSFSLIFEKIEACTDRINIYEPKIPDTEPWLWKNIRIKNNCSSL